MVDSRKISKAVITRLPRYYRYLGDLVDEGIDRISSNELSKRMHVTASQIRQDLNNFGGFGQQGYGYNVGYLREEIGKILGLNDKHDMVIIGAGNLGQALAKYSSFEKRGFIVKGIFDNNPALKGVMVGDIPIRMVSELDDYLKENNIEIAALTIPKENALPIADIAIKNGVKALWNFAHVDLNVPKDVVVENVHLSDSLMKLSYNITQNKEKIE